jgi:hypothetical protein
MKKQISEAGKEQLALALLLLKDFKSEGKFDIEVTRYIYELAEFIGVEIQFSSLLGKLPTFEIKPKI